MTDRIVHVPDVTQGIGSPGMPIRLVREAMCEPQLAKIEYDGGAVFACPTCGGMLDTREASIRAQIDNGLRFQGVPCLGCGKSYTVELSKAPK